MSTNEQDEALRAELAIDGRDGTPVPEEDIAESLRRIKAGEEAER